MFQHRNVAAGWLSLAGAGSFATFLLGFAPEMTASVIVAAPVAILLGMSSGPAAPLRLRNRKDRT